MIPYLLSPITQIIDAIANKISIKYLYSNSPLVEIQNSEAIIKILPEIQKAIVGVVKQVDSNIKCSYARKNSWIDEDLKKIAPYRNQPRVKSVYESLLLLKKGEIMEAIKILLKSTKSGFKKVTDKNI